ADRNRSHWSTSKTPSYTKSVSWQHHLRALSGVMAAGSRQIFANEVATGAKNVGVVLFSIQDPTNIFNVISSAGNSRSVYPVMTSALHNSSWKFYARMQKIDPALDVISGQVMSHILVDVYYE
ncbi:fimbrial-like protein, partial [Escherichia coli]|uniref:fimbrial-like protein n=1 Tax=Escherichia coli TaxID=562 RepID=UPI00223DD4C8